MNMIRKILQENETLRELMAGIVLYGIVIQVILAVFFPLKVFRAVGLWAGILCGLAMAVHMAFCLEKIVEMDEKGAKAYAKRTTLIRYACVCLVLILIAYTKTGDPVTLVLGTLGLKIGAYLQPAVHKVATKCSRKQDNNESNEEGE